MILPKKMYEILNDYYSTYFIYFEFSNLETLSQYYTDNPSIIGPNFSIEANQYWQKFKKEYPIEPIQKIISELR